MPGAGFKTFTAGEVFTATDANTYLMQQAVMVFTNEAARDAAITSPSEGMHAYLTAPTTPAATGGTTYVPSGITTIYNGTAWVCVTPVAAYTSNTGTTTSTTYTNTLSGSPGTNPSVTLNTGTTAMITVGAAMLHNTASCRTGLSVSVSGATTLTGNDVRAIWVVIGNGVLVNQNLMGTFIIDGLTAGSNTFTLAYRVLDAGTGTYDNRRIAVQGIA